LSLSHSPAICHVSISLLIDYPLIFSIFSCLVYTPLLHSSPTRRSSDLLGLIVTGSSDYHGTNKAIRLGQERSTPKAVDRSWPRRSEEHTSELQSRFDLVCRLLLGKKQINRVCIRSMT